MQLCCNSNNMKIVRNTKNKALVLELIQKMGTAISAPVILERTTLKKAVKPKCKRKSVMMLW